MFSFPSFRNNINQSRRAVLETEHVRVIEYYTEMLEQIYVQQRNLANIQTEIHNNIINIIRNQREDIIHLEHRTNNSNRSTTNRRNRRAPAEDQSQRQPSSGSNRNRRTQVLSRNNNRRNVYYEDEPNLSSTNNNNNNNNSDTLTNTTSNTNVLPSNDISVNNTVLESSRNSVLASSLLNTPTNRDSIFNIIGANAPPVIRSATVDWGQPVNTTRTFGGIGGNATFGRNTTTFPLSNFFDNVRVYPTSDQIESATRIIPYSTIESPISSNCPISLAPFSNEEIVSQIIHCGHIFNTVHLIMWFRDNTQCPVCRYDIREYLQDGSGNNVSVSNEDITESYTNSNNEAVNSLEEYEDLPNLENIDSEQDNNETVDPRPPLNITPISTRFPTGPSIFNISYPISNNSPIRHYTTPNPYLIQTLELAADMSMNNLNNTTNNTNNTNNENSSNLFELAENLIRDELVRSMNQSTDLSSNIV